MAQKQIQDLQLRSNFDATVNIPVDDAVQTYRCTGQQVKDFIAPQIAGPSLMGNLSDSLSYPAAIPLSNLKSMLGLLGLDFSKTDRFTPVFEKTDAETLSLKAGTSVFVNGKTISFASTTPVTMPSFSGKVGTDFAIFVCDDGEVIADENFSAPTGYDPEEAKLIGGFHYGLVGPTETVAGGSFASSGNGFHWDQPAVNLIRGINVYSIWDLKFRPACDDPRGMALVANSFWADIYLCNTNPAVNGTSKYNSDVASGTVLPKIPAAFGGDGSASYANLNWWTANEIVKGYGKRLMSNAEFCAAAFGVTESQSIGTGAVSTTTGQALGSGSNTIAFTGRVAGYTSRWGLEQASGNQYTWGADASYRYDGTQTFSWKNENGGRGQVYTEGTYGLVYVVLGGSRGAAANSGSRCSDWGTYPWHSFWSLGVRAACDPLKLG